jgi:hydroxymethylpyrimidine pyrophosphatase-like HAD family hydrolase
MSLKKIEETHKYDNIFCDIDGTLTELEKGCLDLEAVSYLRALRRKSNLEVILVSGRGESATFFLSRDLGFQDAKHRAGYIAENGGVICTYDKDGALVKTYLGDKIELWEVLRKTITDDEFEMLKNYSVYEKTRLTDIIISKTCPLLTKESFISELKKAKISITDSGSPDMHIHFTRINKGEGIKQYLLKRYEEEDPIFNFKKYLDNSIFCGNADNDIEAALLVGSSVAVNNCSEGLKKVADHITSKCYGKGVIEGIEYFLSR